MRFVILSSKPIPTFNGIHGPILTPTEYDVHLVLNMLALGIDVREVMDDGSYRKLKYNDEKLMELLADKNEKSRSELKERRNNKNRVAKNEPQGNVRLKEERPAFKPKKEKQKPKEEVKQEHKKQKPKEEVVPQEPKKDLIIDNLEKPE